MDCVKASIRQFDCPSVRRGHISKLLQLGNGHGNSGICPEARIQCCHCHAGAGFSVQPCCTDRLVNTLRPYRAFRLGDADGLRASKFKHAVEDMNCNGNFGRAAPIRS